MIFPRAVSRSVPGMSILLVVSDIEMGEVGPFDDFPHDPFLAELFAAYTEPPYDGLPVDLVLNGDIFDLFKVPHDGQFKRHITVEIALEKLDIVLEGHPAFLEGLRHFGEHSSGNKRIHFIAGNHDLEMLFPQLKTKLQHALFDVASLNFYDVACQLGPVFFEHGHQHDEMFRIDDKQPFVYFRGELILNLPWGSTSLLDVVLPMRELFYHQDRLYPRNFVLQRMPYLQEILLRSFRRYFTRDYLPGIVREWDDPTRRITRSMVKEVLLRFYSEDPNVATQDQPVMDMLNERDDIQAICMGHLHVPWWQMSGNKYLFRTGCMRDEYMINLHNDGIEPIQKSYGEIVLIDGQIADVRLHRVPGPERASGTYPSDVFEFTQEMQQLLEALRTG